MKSAALLAVLSALSTTGAAAQTPAVGEPFPVQRFPRIGADGLHSIAEYRGKKLLLIQFASW